MAKTKQQKKESMVLGKLLRKIAPKIGARVVLEPNWEIAGQIIFKSGKASYFRYSTLDINSVGSADIAKDKDYANFFIERWGYPVVPDSKTFCSEEFASMISEMDHGPAEAADYARKLGFPVVVKPNSSSQGRGVCVAMNDEELSVALEEAFSMDRVIIVQRYLTGRDYRVVVLGDRVISAYQRLPLMVIGDGELTISDLLRQKTRQFIEDKRNCKSDFDDPRIDVKLTQQGLSRASVLPMGRQVFLLDNANLSTGGTSIDVTDAVHPEFQRLCVDLTRKMGLKLCGVDLMIDGDIAAVPEEGKWWVLEINAAPGLDNYVRTGDKQRDLVEQLYLEVLKEIERS